MTYMLYVIKLGLIFFFERFCFAGFAQELTWGREERFELWALLLWRQLSSDQLRKEVMITISYKSESKITHGHLSVNSIMVLNLTYS